MRVFRYLGTGILVVALWPGLLRGDSAALDAAKQAFAKGDYHKAVDLLKGATAADPGNGDLYILLSRSYLQLDQYEAAVTAGEKAVALSPKNSEFHRLLGEAY